MDSRNILGKTVIAMDFGLSGLFVCHQQHWRFVPEPLEKLLALGARIKGVFVQDYEKRLRLIGLQEGILQGLRQQDHVPGALETPLYGSQEGLIRTDRQNLAHGLGKLHVAFQSLPAGANRLTVGLSLPVEGARAGEKAQPGAGLGQMTVLRGRCKWGSVVSVRRWMARQLGRWTARLLNQRACLEARSFRQRAQHPRRRLVSRADTVGHAYPGVEGTGQVKPRVL